ncbi:MAG: CocE/NonD family hydrolase [Planctomycetaceae bacterium]
MRDHSEEQDEVLTFTTDVLSEPVEWTGKVETELYISSDAPDTDFIVRVSDVYPDGRSILIVDMIRRARFRDGFETEKMMEPGEVYKVKFYVGWLSQIFNKGHRIRVTVASTGAPFFEPNPNTGEPLTIESPENRKVATNVIYHNQQYSSKVIAPVVKLKQDYLLEEYTELFASFTPLELISGFFILGSIGFRIDVRFFESVPGSHQFQHFLSVA